MVIRSVKDIEARRAAAEQEPDSPPSSGCSSGFAVSPPSRSRRTAAQGSDVSSSKTGTKRQPVGDHDVGYCRPPVEHRFRKGGKPGPGRPKGSLSHDTILKRQLEQKQRVRINGREKNLSLRELILTKAVLAAVEGKDWDARKYVLGESARLYGVVEDAGSGGAAEVELSESDALSAKEFMADLRAEVRAEIEAELSNQGDRP